MGDLRGFEVAPFSPGPPGPRFGNPRTWGHYAQRAQYAADTWVPPQALREGRAAWLLTHFDGAYLPPVCFVCAPSAPLCLCCRRVMRAQVRFRLSRTAMCNVPQPSQVSSMLSPSMNGLSPRWLVPVARMSPGAACESR